MRKSMLSKGISILCSVVLAAALVPATAVAAFAYDGDVSFTVDGVKYTANGSKDVRVAGYVASELSSTVTIPSTVTNPDTGATYCVSNIEENAFSGCKMEELRISSMVSSTGDAGQIYPTAFKDCYNLKVIHLMGQGTFVGGQHLTYDFDRCMDGLSIVFHSDHEGLVSSSQTYGSGDRQGVKYPNMTTYFAVDFQQGGTSTTVYVKGASGVWEGSTYTVTDGVTCADLASLSSEDIYIDGDLCTQEAPALEGSNDSWAFTAYAASGTASTAAANTAINSTGVAVAASSKDLTYATMSLASTTLRYTSQPVSVKATVLGTDNAEVADSCYSLSYYAGESSASGEPIDASQVVEEGTYTVAATGNAEAGYTGSCETTFTVEKQAASWARYGASSDCSQALTAMLNAPTMISNAGSETTLSKKLRILVNGNNWQDCLVAASLAGALKCPLVTTDGTALSTDVKVSLASASGATVVVVGSKTAVPDAVKTAATDATGGSSLRVDGADGNTLSQNAMTFVKKALAGDYALITLDSETQHFGTTAFVLPATYGIYDYAAAAWAAAEGAPVVFAQDDAGTLAESDASFLAENGVTSLVKVALAASAAETDGFENSTVALADGTDFQKVLDVNEAAVKAGALSYENVALALNTNPGVMASAAASCGLSGSVVMFLDASGADTTLTSALGGNLKYRVSQGYVFANMASFSASSLEDFQKIWDDEDYANLRFATITATDVTTTGTAVEPKVTVTDSAGTVLTAGTDYTLSYYNVATGAAVKASKLNTPGTYTVTATGTRHLSTGINMTGSTTEHTEEYVGTYYNTRSTTFTVKQGTAPTPAATPAAQKLAKPAKAKIKTAKSKAKKKLAVTWAKAARAATYQIQWRVKGKSAWKSKTVKATKVTLTKLTSKKKYQVRVRAKNATGYGAWSTIKTVKVK